MKKPAFLIFFSLILLTSAVYCRKTQETTPGAYSVKLYKDLIKNKALAIVANQTSMIGKTHLVDSLFSLKMNIKLIFSPEHGFRNMADAGEKIEDGKDPGTGIPLISLYGSHLKPTPEDLKGIDMVIFDIQDVEQGFIHIYLRFTIFLKHVLKTM